jgi:hypothetical protein
MRLLIIILNALFTNNLRVLAQKTSGNPTSFVIAPSQCPVPGQVTSFSGCNSMYSSLAVCSSIYSAGNNAGFSSCLCQQGLFNNIWEYVVIPRYRFYTCILPKLAATMRKGYALEMQI